MIAVYKRIRATVQTGSLYRLISPSRDPDLASSQYVAQDGSQAVLFAFRHSQQYNTAVAPIRLRGLDDKAMYTLESVDGKLEDKESPLSGAYLMNHGVMLNLRGDYDSTAVILQRR
jgi:alpha-galactosidase